MKIVSLVVLVVLLSSADSGHLMSADHTGIILARIVLFMLLLASGLLLGETTSKSRSFR